MRIGWYVTKRGNGEKPWLMEKKLWSGEVVYYRANGRQAAWRTQEGAQRVADRVNREEAVS